MKNISLLLIIVLVGATLRLFGLGSFPIGISQDEVQQGYSAYSILQTGKDEWGEVLPLAPRGFGDFKAPLYTYLLIPSVWFFGLEEVSLRVPSALVGITTILVFYFLLTELFKNPKLGLVGALFLAISPWHIQYSRVGWEGNLNALLFSAGLLFFLKGLQKKRVLILAGFFWSLNMYSYHGARVFTIIFLIFLIWLFREFLFKNLRSLLIPVILGFILVTPLFLSQSIFTRASDVSVFNPTDNFAGLRVSQGEERWPFLGGKLFSNKATYLVDRITQNYLNYFSVNFYFTGSRSENSYLNLPGFPLFYIWELPLIVGGIIFLLKSRNKQSLILLIWLLVAPIPAVLSKDGHYIFRGVAVLPVLSITSAIGLYKLYEKIPKNSIYKIGGLFLVILSVGIFIDFYIMHLPHKNLGDFQYGFDKVIAYTEEYKKNNQLEEVIFTREYSNPQIFVAFYKKVNPIVFQSYASEYLEYEKRGLKYVDQLGEYKLLGYRFRNISWAEDRNRQSVLLIGAPNVFPEKVVTDLTIVHPSKKIIFKVVNPNFFDNNKLNI